MSDRPGLHAVRTALAGGLLLAAAVNLGCAAGNLAASGDDAPKGAAATTVTVQSLGGPGFALGDPAGLTLYYFAGDDPGSATSGCDAACARQWPPLTAPTAAVVKPAALPSTLDTIRRSDGTLQVRYDGRALYRFASDRVPGERNGQGVASWTVAFVELACDCGH